MIEIKNKMRQMQVFNLDAPYYKGQEGRNGKGKAEALTFLALEKKVLEEQVLSCNEVKAAVDKGTLQILRKIKEPKEKLVAVMNVPEPKKKKK